MIQQLESTGRGRLTAEREAEVYDAVLDVLIADGYTSFTLDEVARRAHCSKATLYRNWSGKQDLVLSALAHDKARHEAVDVDTGSLRGDLHAWADRVGSGSERTARLMLAIAHACSSDDDLARAARALVVEAGDDDTDGIARAIARGELDEHHPGLEHLMLMVAGPLVLSHVLRGEPPSADHLKSYIDAVVLPALGLHP